MWNEHFFLNCPVALDPIRDDRNRGVAYAEVQFCVPGGSWEMPSPRETLPVETCHYFLGASASANYTIILISHFHIYKIGIIAVSTLYSVGRIDGDVCISELLNK